MLEKKYQKVNLVPKKSYKYNLILGTCLKKYFEITEPLTMESRFRNTMVKMEYLKNLPSRPILIQKWECEIYRECKTNNVLKKYISDPTIVTPIISNREPFFGGRTENFYRYFIYVYLEIKIYIVSNFQ